MRKRPVQQQLFHALALSLIIALIGGGVALLNQWHQVVVPSHAASSDSVVGPPSLPAATVDSILRHMGSPMTGVGQAVETASRAANIDDAFALAVWWTETNDGAAGVGLADRNPGSVRGSVGYPSAYDGYTIYPSYTAAVNYWFPMLQRVYIARGLTTVSAISHPYVGTSTSYLWAGKVIALMQRYRGEAPPPSQATATTVPATPTISASMLRVEKTLKQRAEEQSQAASTSSVVTTQQRQSTPQTALTPAPGLSTRTQQMLVLFNLLLAFALGALAWSMSRRYAARPRPVVQPVSNVWEQLQASQQSPAAFFRQQSLSGLLRTTEDLPYSAPQTGMLIADAANSGMFADTNPLQPAYTSSGAHFSLSSVLANQVPQTPQPAPSTGQLSFNEPALDYLQTAHLPRFGAGLPSQPTQANVPAPNPLHRTRLQPSQPAPGQFWSPAEASSQQPQPVGVGAGAGRPNGLLSRYRAQQEQDERRY